MENKLPEMSRLFIDRHDLKSFLKSKERQVPVLCLERPGELPMIMQVKEIALLLGMDPYYGIDDNIPELLGEELPDGSETRPLEEHVYGMDGREVCQDLQLCLLHKWLQEGLTAYEDEHGTKPLDSYDGKSLAYKFEITTDTLLGMSNREPAPSPEEGGAPRKRGQSDQKRQTYTDEQKATFANAYRAVKGFDPRATENDTVTQLSKTDKRFKGIPLSTLKKWIPADCKNPPGRPKK